MIMDENKECMEGELEQWELNCGMLQECAFRFTAASTTHIFVGHVGCISDFFLKIFFKNLSGEEGMQRSVKSGRRTTKMQLLGLERELHGIPEIVLGMVVLLFR